MTARAGSVVTYNPNNSSIDSTDFYYAFANAYSGNYNALRLVPGNYTIINPYGGFHFLAACSSAQRSPFELDFGGSTFVLTVGLQTERPAAVSLLLTPTCQTCSCPFHCRLHAHLSSSSGPTEAVPDTFWSLWLYGSAGLQEELASEGQSASSHTHLHEMPCWVQDGTAGGFFFSYCNNVLVHNATIYYDFSQNPWYQATITDISPNGQVWNITVSLFPPSCRQMQ